MWNWTVLDEWQQPLGVLPTKPHESKFFPAPVEEEATYKWDENETVAK